MKNKNHVCNFINVLPTFPNVLENDGGKLSLRRLNSCYNKCVKLFFKFKRSDSVTSAGFVRGVGDLTPRRDG